jgi:hypothetical protein
VVGRQLYSVRRALEAESGIRQKGEADSFLERSAPQHCGPNHGQSGNCHGTTVPAKSTKGLQACAKKSSEELTFQLVVHALMHSLK